MAETVKIAIVDDDWGMREAIKTLVETVGLSTEGFSSAQEFLSSQHAQDSQCLILDVRIPGMSGFELQRHLVKHNCRIPIIFMTAYYSETERARAIEACAVDFLQKPFDEQALFNAIQSALLTYRSSAV
jgi:two-component system, LuxR family, response regulator FixJ